MNKKCYLWGSWMAQLVEHLTPGFGSGHDLRVPGSKPLVGSTLSEESLPLSLSLSPLSNALTYQALNKCRPNTHHPYLFIPLGMNSP